MTVSVSRRRPPEKDQHTELVVAGAGDETRGLIQGVVLGAGVEVRLDLARPFRWQGIRVEHWDDGSRPLVRALIGSAAVAVIDRTFWARTRQGAECAPAERLEIDLGEASPWLRVAAADALDHWLHLPLDQSLLDAERGVARVHAAQTLPPGAARQEVVNDALRIARTASHGLVAYLADLARHKHAVPAGLSAALAYLISGYELLNKEVVGRDRDLLAVVKAGSRLPGPRLEAPDQGYGDPAEGTATPAAADDASAGSGQVGTVVRSAAAAAASSTPAGLINPRHVPARVLRLSSDPTAAEISMTSVHLRDVDAVQIRVPAYNRDSATAEVSDRLLVRLVDRASGQERAEALMILEPGSGDGDDPVFRGTLPLRGVALGSVRAEVFDALSEFPDVVESDSTLQIIRRATLFLREWRRLVAEVRLPAAVPDVGERIRAMVALLGAARARFPEEVMMELKSADGEPPALGDADESDWTMTAGPGRLLVAELAAAYQARSA